MHILEQNPFYEAHYDTAHKLIIFSISGDVEVGRIRSYLARQIEWSNDHKVLGICADLTKLEGTIAPLTGFIATEYLAPLKESGMFGAAIVVSEEIMSRLAARDFVRRMGEQGIVMFHDKADAMKWLHHRIQNHRQAASTFFAESKS